MAVLGFRNSLLLSSLLGLVSWETAAAQDLVNCTLCEDPMAVLTDPDAFFSDGTDLRRCREEHDRGARPLGLVDCLFLQTVGREICGCELATITPSVAPTTDDSIACTLCEDGSELGFPDLEVFPSQTCADLQQIAAGPDGNLPERCAAWQATVGVYCGCNNPLVVSAGVCRICGDQADILDWDPLQVSSVNGLSCGELEFQANTPGLDCAQFQNVYSVDCCEALPSNPPSSSPPTQNPSQYPSSPPPSSSPSSLPSNPPSSTPTTSAPTLVPSLDPTPAPTPWPTTVVPLATTISPTRREVESSPRDSDAQKKSGVSTRDILLATLMPSVIILVGLIAYILYERSKYKRAGRWDVFRAPPTPENA